MTCLFFCNLLVTSDSALSPLSPPTPCPVSLFHTSQRFYQCPEPTRYWPFLQLECVLFSYWLWKKNKTLLFYRRLWKWLRQDLIYLYRKGYLISGVALIFWKSVTDKTFESKWASASILPLNFLASLTISVTIQCLPVWTQNDWRETSQNVGTLWSLTSFQDKSELFSTLKKDETLVRK